LAGIWLNGLSPPDISLVNTTKLMKTIKQSTLVKSILAAAACAAAGYVAYAAVTIEDDGTGFVGKGDVQLVYGWNNKQLQDNAESVDFRVNREEVTEVSWECTNPNNEKVQERARTTTTSIAGVVSAVARERNQITGFDLTGYKGTPTIGSSVTEGPAVNSCPSGFWTLTTPAGVPEVVSSTGGLQVSIDGEKWVDLE
jgi:hypothetical protein